jgi:hypothetical protein
MNDTRPVTHRAPPPPPPKPVRQAIQIVGTSTPDGDADLFALCNDGTIWGLGHSGQWVEMPAIPQDESKDPLATLRAKNIDLREKIVDLEKTLDTLRNMGEALVDHRSPIKKGVGCSILKILG